MKKTLAIVLALMMLVLALPVGAAGTGGDNDIPFNDLIGKTDPVVVSIAVTTTPKTEYLVGEELDVAGGKVTLTYDDETTEEIDLTAEMVSFFDSSAAKLVNLTVTYGELTTSYQIEVKEPWVTGMEITTLPTKLTYQVGEMLDTTDGKITLTYCDNTTKEIDLTADMVFGYSDYVTGEQILTVSYEGFEDTFAITVKAPVVLSGIAVTTMPEKEAYARNNELDVTGGKITLTYSDNTTKEIDMTNDMVSGYNPKGSGKQTLTVTYEGFTAQFTVMSGLRINSASLVLQASLTMNWKTQADIYGEGGFENPYFVFQFYDENGDVEERTVTEYTVDSGYYVFAFTGVGANRMADKVVGTVYATYNGEECVANSVEYSVLAYANSQLGKATDTKLKTILVDMLNYGAAAQIYNEYNLENLANASLTEEQKSWGTANVADTETHQNTKYATVENPVASWKGAGLVLGSSVVIRPKFQIDDLTGVSVKVTSATKSAEITEFELVTGQSNQYYIYYDGLDANQMRTPVLFTVYKDGVAISHTLQYSIVSYAHGKTAGTTTLNKLCAAMMNFGDAVAAMYPPSK